MGGAGEVRGVGEVRVWGEGMHGGVGGGGRHIYGVGGRGQGGEGVGGGGGARVNACLPGSLQLQPTPTAHITSQLQPTPPAHSYSLHPQLTATAYTPSYTVTAVSPTCVMGQHMISPRWSSCLLARSR